MTRIRKMMISILTVAVLLVTMTVNVFAAEEYTYKVTFYVGVQGTFSGEDDLSVTGSDYMIHRTEDRITISGLKAGSVVSFNAQEEGAVVLDTDSKYYVKGLRKSGRDNSTVEASAFHVTEDQDYVVAYGIKGNLTSYTVNYVDAEGNAIAESSTYYGNVGDKPVVAYKYVAGYLPQAYGLTKTLSENAAENVFTFVYSRIQTEQIVVPGEGSGVTNDDEPGTESDVSEDDIPEPVVPEVAEPDDIIDLDEEPTPAGNIDLDKMGMTVVVSIAIGLLALVAFVVLLFVVKKREEE